MSDFHKVMYEEPPFSWRIADVAAQVAGRFIQGFVMGIGFAASVSLLLWARVI